MSTHTIHPDPLGPTIASKMLKRQRPASPSPSSPSIPLITDSPLMDVNYRDTKRRRILPPVLDGPSRGWATHRETHNGEDEDEDDDEEVVVGNDSQQDWHDAGAASSAEYKATNNFLHELHALHQHRLAFASPPSHLTAGFPPNLSDHSYPYTPATSGKTASLISPEPLTTHFQSRDLDLYTKGPVSISALDSSIEVQRVKERYEDTNK